MEEYCETHQLVRKRREIFENLARQNAEASKIEIKRTNRPWSRNLTKCNYALNVPIGNREEIGDNLRRVSNDNGPRYSRSTTINTIPTSDSLTINRSDRNRHSSYYGDYRKSFVPVFSASDQKLQNDFNQIAMDAKKEEEEEQVMEEIVKISDKISASVDIPIINHNNNTLIEESSEGEESICDDFGKNEAPSILPVLVETINLAHSEPNENIYEKYFEENVYAEIDDLPKALPADVDSKQLTDVDSERWSEEDEFSDSFDSGTEEDEHDYEIAPLPPPVEVNIGKIHNVLNEIMTTEDDYVKKLEIGIANYVRFMDNVYSLPLDLKGKKNQIFGVIEKIYEFHRHKFYPALLQCNYDLDEIIEKFRFFIQKDYFYSYVLYAMNKPKSEAVVRENQQFFHDRQNSIDDKLGLPSFLMQPIQRLPKYRLLISEMIKEFMKNIEKIENNGKLKNTLGNLCVTEKELQKVLDAANESISVNDIQFDDTFINIHHQGKFIRCGEFEIHDHSKTKAKYRGKIFLFNKALIYTEYATPDKKHLTYRGSYDRNKLGLRHDQSESSLENKKKFYIFESKMGHNELEFNRTEDNHDNWYLILQQILYDVMEEERKRVKLNQFRMSKLQMNESMRTSLVKFNQTADAADRTSSTSSGSITSDYISNRSSRCSADSYEIGNSTWQERKNSDKIRNSEKYYLNYLRCCRKAYIEQITNDEQKTRITKFQKEIDRIYNFHKNFLLPRILECGANYEDIYRLFQMVCDTGKFHLYIKYAMATNIGYDVLMDLFANGSSPSTNPNVLTVDEYVKLPIYRIKYYLSLLDSYMHENKSNNNWNTDIFKTVAMLQSNLYKIHKKVEETYKLYAIRQNSVRLSLYGSCEFSDLVSIDKFSALNHRICIMEDGLILIKIKNTENQEEYYKEIVFNLPYSLGLNMRGSKKNPKKISFDTNSQKSVGPGITFRSLEKREIFKNTLCNIKK